MLVPVLLPVLLLLLLLTSSIKLLAYICRQLVDMSLLRISLHRLAKKSRKTSRFCKVVTLTPLT